MKKTLQVMTLAIFPTIIFAQAPNLISITKENVQRQLKDPQSAQFREVKVVTNTLNEKTVCGEVNAKNSYGGYTGFKAFYTTDGRNINFIDNTEKPSQYKKNLVKYSQAGCLGEAEELATRKSENIKKVCEANYDLIRKVVVEKKNPDVAYTELLKNNESYYASSGFTPSKETMFSELEKFKADKTRVKEIKSSVMYYPKYSERCISENTNN